MPGSHHAKSASVAKVPSCLSWSSEKPAMPVDDLDVRAQLVDRLGDLDDLGVAEGDHDALGAVLGGLRDVLAVVTRSRRDQDVVDDLGALRLGDRIDQQVGLLRLRAVRDHDRDLRLALVDQRVHDADEGEDATTGEVEVGHGLVLARVGLGDPDAGDACVGEDLLGLAEL